MLTWNTRPEPTTIVCLSATGMHRDPMPMCSIWTVTRSSCSQNLQGSRLPRNWSDKFGEGAPYAGLAQVACFAPR